METMNISSRVKQFNWRRFLRYLAYAVAFTYCAAHFPFESLQSIYGGY